MMTMDRSRWTLRPEATDAMKMRTMKKYLMNTMSSSDSRTVPQRSETPGMFVGIRTVKDQFWFLRSCRGRTVAPLLHSYSTS